MMKYLFVTFFAALTLLVISILSIPSSQVAVTPTPTSTATTTPVSVKTEILDYFDSNSKYPLGVLAPFGSGHINPVVTQENIKQTICKSGWTATIRPSTNYTNPIKYRLMNQRGYSTEDAKLFELDHIIPLELGGAPSDPRNLYLEPWNITVDGIDLGAHSKDKVENYLKRQVCNGNMTLNEAQVEIALDWVSVYKKIK